MITKFCKITTDNINNAQIFERGGEIIRRGGLVAFPTETVYGLGANALDSSAAKKIYAAKGRPSDNPLIIHIARVEDAESFCFTNELFYKLAESFWPGPLTIVMKKRDCVPSDVTGGLDTVAIRLPADENARALIEASGRPIAAPSANLSGKPSPTKASHVLDDMNGRIDMIIDGGDCKVGVESTIVKVDGDRLTLLRPGGITVEMLERIAPLSIDKAVTEKLAEGEKPLAPGMKYRHYAPETRVVLVDSTHDRFIEFVKEQSKSHRIGAMILDSDKEELADCGAVLFPIGDRPGEQAHNLFAELRMVDNCGCETIYAPLPEKTGIGLAVYNRIVKAAGYEIIKLDPGS